MSLTGDGFTQQWLGDSGRTRGSVAFSESSPYFADNDLGDGAGLHLRLTYNNDVMAGDKCPIGIRCRVVIERWTAWNRFEWVQV